MKTKSRRLFPTLLAAVLLFSLLAAMPLTASAEDGPFFVTEHPVGATYNLNAAAAPLRATFEYKYSVQGGSIHSDTPIRVQWYWSYENSNTDRSNGLGESTVPYDREITHTTTHVPATDVVGVKYYYAVLTYAASIPVTSGQWEEEPRQAVTDPARIEVIAPEQGLRVRKVDENGNPLAGAIIIITPSDAIDAADLAAHTYEATTGADGYASFTVAPGSYVISELKAPDGYNATDDKYYIHVNEDEVVLYAPGTNFYQPYETVNFVNKKIPFLNPDDHFAYMQGYPAGTFQPSRNMTRAEAVVMFSRLLSEKMDMTTDYRYNCYPDVEYANPSMQLPWYANQVCYMHSLGVLADFSRDGRFRPDEFVTRAEFATLAAHFENLVLTDVNVFSDVPADHWAVKYINSSHARGWINGYPDGTFKPESNIIRAEVVTLVNRMLERAADEGYLAANAGSLPRNYSDLLTTHWAYFNIMEASTGHDFVKNGESENWTTVYP
ncbi:MAG: S-layer homology domain-containing protein [Oscillospiraceae bacterium]|jgi:hypothetical protein|nr:S-layer homology domain-containing protein [Oscillospiraceae bacterium]